jgi:hypothetical protein
MLPALISTCLPTRARVLLGGDELRVFVDKMLPGRKSNRADVRGKIRMNARPGETSIGIDIDF